MVSKVNTPQQAGGELLDQLFTRTAAYRSGEEFQRLIAFIASFRSQSPYNAFLLHRQFPYVSFVATAHTWESIYDAELKADARPLVILKNFGPVDFVYDVSDVKSGDIPRALREQQAMSGTVNHRRVSTLITSAQHHGIGIEPVQAPFTFYGRASKYPEPREVRRVRALSASPSLFDGSLFETGDELIKSRFVVSINNALGVEQTYATLLHELAHVLCGHLGPLALDSSSKLARDRTHVPTAVAELEAEAASYIAGVRTGVDFRSEEYLAQYLERVMDDRYKISLDAILTTAGDLERWGNRPTRPTKRAASESTSAMRRRSMRALKRYDGS